MHLLLLVSSSVRKLSRLISESRESTYKKHQKCSFFYRMFIVVDVSVARPCVTNHGRHVSGLRHVAVVQNNHAD